MTEHPSPAVLRRFLAGRLPREEAREVIRHLVPGCEACGAAVSGLAAFLRATEAGRLPQAPEADADVYEAPLRRAFAAVRLHGTRLPEIKKKTGRALALFTKRGVTGPAAKQQGAVPVYEAALARSQALRHENPQGMIQHALVAVQISQRMEKEGYTPEQAADFQARALGELANAHRVADRLGEAEDLMRQALGYASAGTGDLFVNLRLKDLKASLLGSQHRYGETILLLSDLVQENLRLGDQLAAARALVNMGTFRGHAGEPEEAVRILLRAEAMIDESTEPGLKLSAIHNRLWFLVDLGRLQEALSALLEISSRRDQAGALERLKFLYLEGRILASLGNLQHSEQRLRAARDGLVKLARGHAALVGLDLAAVVMRQGRHREGLVLAAEALQEFTRLQLDDQIAEALLVLAEAITQRLVTATLVQSVADFVRKAEHDPRARYEPRFE